MASSSALSQARALLPQLQAAAASGRDSKDLLTQLKASGRPRPRSPTPPLDASSR